MLVKLFTEVKVEMNHDPLRNDVDEGKECAGQIIKDATEIYRNQHRRSGFEANGLAFFDGTRRVSL